jgi:hypothetical protein
LELQNKCIGNYTIYLKKYSKCQGCGALLFPKETAAIIAQKEEIIRNNLIRKLPVSEFVVATEAAEILGVTRQAFHKHQKIKKGFIYSTIIGGKRLYNKKSVLLFKENGDGRFNLSKPIVKEAVKYIYVPVSVSPADVNYVDNLEGLQGHFWKENEVYIDSPHYDKYIQ